MEQNLPINVEEIRYVMVPSVGSTAFLCAYVVGLFILYMIYVGYIVSYDLAYVPNYRMFVNFLTDNQHGLRQFNDHVGKIVCEGAQSGQQESFTGDRHVAASAAVYEPNPTILENLKKEWNRIYNHGLLKLYMKGNTFRVYGNR